MTNTVYAMEFVSSTVHISIFGGIISHCSSSKCSVFCLFVFCEALLSPTYTQDPFGDNFYVPFRKTTQV